MYRGSAKDQQQQKQENEYEVVDGRGRRKDRQGRKSLPAPAVGTRTMRDSLAGPY